MLKRSIIPTLTELLSHYPAVALLGSRQCGKTTEDFTVTGVVDTTDVVDESDETNNTTDQTTTFEGDAC